MEITNVAEEGVVENLYSPSIHYPYPLLKRFHLGFVYVVFGILTALNMSVILWNLSLLYIKYHLYTSMYS